MVYWISNGKNSIRDFTHMLAISGDELIDPL
ncbi:MAG: hypothetical protein RIR18_817 [Pseudomonadota bacterium]